MADGGCDAQHVVPSGFEQRTRDYIARRSAEGKTMGEIARMLKRYIAREIFKTLPTTI